MPTRKPKVPALKKSTRKKKPAKKRPKKVKLDLSGLERFTKSDKEFKLTKIASKRPNSWVGVGQYEIGEFSLIDLTHKGAPGKIGVYIQGRGFNYLRTSPILKVTEQTEDSTTFETEGGVYKLEVYVPGVQALE